MISKRYFFSCCALLLGFFSAISQNAIQLSPKAEISVLTCGPGDQLYTSFGHSAFRVKDPEYPFDIVYNYGTFDFDTPGFYTKFARGKLLYQLTRSRFERFLAVYNYENRWVKEQVLELSQQQKQDIFDFLEQNALPENRDYKYDFFFENCATKKWDVMQAVDQENFLFDETYTESKTFREALQAYLHFNTWGSFGIDLALGAVADRQATSKELMYLPDYVYTGFDKAKNNSTALVKAHRVLLEKPKRVSTRSFFTSPLFFCLLLLSLVAGFTFKDLKRGKRSRGVDFLLFLTTGMAGLIISYLWFLTDHTATHYNFNIFWAFLPNLVIAAVIVKRKLPNWMKTYLWLLVILLGLALLFWVFNIQVFPKVIVVIWASLLLRYAYLIRYLNHLPR